MNKKFRSILTMALALVLVAIMVVGCTGPKTPAETTGGDTTGGGDVVITPATFKQAEYNTTTSTMPSNWNELTYQDNNDTQIMSYIGSSFFTYDYKFEDDKKFNADGSINVEGIIPGSYTTNYSAATKLEDVTKTVDAKWGYTDAQKAEGGYAWKITLRDDLKWDDGTAITAADFVYSMKAQLDPAFMNYRGNTFYDTLRIKNSRGYFFQNQEGTYETIGSQNYENNQAAVDAGEKILVDCFEFWGAAGYVDAEGNPAPQWVPYNDETIYNSAAAWADPNNADIQDPFSGKLLWDNFLSPTGKYAGYVEVGAQYQSWLSIYRVNEIREMAWENVGIYSIDSENAIVVCLDKGYDFLKEDGSLSYLAAYYMSGLPLVKQDLYESCKIEPAEGATLWTSNYNSSLETTASWGPYKLVEFEAGSHYKLVKNENWFGYGLEENKNQYNITAINCTKVSEFATKWMGFLNGTYDDAALSTENIADYFNSKYVTYAPDTGTYGMQLYSNLSVLKNSENNNGILAIQAFRHAFSLSLNRADIVEKIWPGTATPCLGLVNSEYYYDIENSPTLEDSGVYRNTKQAMAGLLRAYGYTEDANGKWSSGDLTGLSLEDAYETMTGYNPTVAKQRFQEAVTELTTNAETYGYDATKDITLVYGSSVDTAKQRDRAAYLQKVLDDLSAGTALEGKIKIVFDASAGDGWSDAFRNGDTQIGFGYGFTGNAFNPFDIIGAFVNPDDSLNYHTYWDTAVIDMTLTMPEGDYEGAGETITMSLQNWYFCLNGLAGENNQAKQYNWDAGYAPASVRLTILSALEEVALKECRSVMLIGEYGGSFLGAKFSYLTSDYNTFMGFGGMRYMVVNYTDSEWTAYVEQNANDLTNEYKKTE